VAHPGRAGDRTAGAARIHQELTRGAEVLRLAYEPAYDPLPKPNGQKELKLDTVVDRSTLEHEQYVLRGQAKIGIGAETFEVKQGDVVFIPEGVPHFYENIGEEPFEFLCIIPNKEDKIVVVDETTC